MQLLDSAASLPSTSGTGSSAAMRQGGIITSAEIKMQKLKDRITPHVTNFFRLRLTIEKQEGKRKYKSDGAVMVGEFVCMYVCSCTVSE